MFCCTLLYVKSSFAIILMVALLSRVMMMVVWLFLSVPLVCLWFVIVVFPDHTISDEEMLSLTNVIYRNE